MPIPCYLPFVCSYCYSLGGDAAAGEGNRVAEVDSGSWTTVLVEKKIGWPLSRSITAPRTSVSSFLNSASSTAFPSPASATLSASSTTAST